MSDFDRLLQQSLKQAAESHEPASLSTARSRFVRTRRRRSLFTAATSLAVLAAFVTTVVAAPWDRSSNTDIVGPAPGPTARPGEMLIKGEIELQEAPSDLDIDGDFIYVASAESRAIAVMDPQSNQTVQVRDDFLVKSWGPGVFDVVDVGEGAIRAIRDDVLYRVAVHRSDESPYGDVTLAEHWSGPLSDLAVTEDNLWVAGSSPVSDSDETAIFRFESPSGPKLDDRARGRIETGEPARLDYGLGYLWAAQSTNADWITRIDPSSLQRTVVPAPKDGNELDALLEVSAGAGSVWTHAPDRLFRINPESAEIDGEWSLPGHSSVLEATEDLGIFVMAHINDRHSRLYRIDPITGDMLGQPMKFGRGPFALESGFGSLWVADQSNAEVLRIEVGSKREVEASDRERRQIKDQIKDLMKLLQELGEKRHAFSEGFNFEGMNGDLTKEEKRAYQRRIEALEQAILKAQARLDSLKEN